MRDMDMVFSRINSQEDLVKELLVLNVQIDDSVVALIQNERFFSNVKGELNLVLGYFFDRKMLCRKQCMVKCDFDNETLIELNNLLPFYEAHWTVFTVDYPKDINADTLIINVKVRPDSYDRAKEVEAQKIDAYVSKKGLGALIKEAERKEQANQRHLALLGPFDLCGESEIPQSREKLHR